MKITVIPAIDLKDGKCVRLRQGRADDVVAYSEDPVGMARHWVDEGAHYLHVVDLDGAFQGKPVHAEVIGRICKAIKIPVEVGGGLRSDRDIEQMLTLGVTRVVLGTRACQDPDVLHRLAKRFGDALAVGIDARNGMVQVKGWTETTGMKAVDLARQADGLGVRCIIYTDTARDGMLGGVNAHAVDQVCAGVQCPVIASGGVSSQADMQALKALRRANLTGAIVGKALYEGRVKLNELQGEMNGQSGVAGQ
ncbi:MAG TPA: 1-(5-phosphoribosyl)-5-[(5-phosphoribosylamino)methylideneamino]imidazole-4-carboxamide isomerase [Kiritimatiellia bacterium]|nr:1-(5-phosphoribosyl)-5-[(5-phosphoribosylamino)methylideneamino]imidazole-4-carboxamide isomerase [Kiritimatiellia bacterium]